MISILEAFGEAINSALTKHGYSKVKFNNTSLATKKPTVTSAVVQKSTTPTQVGIGARALVPKKAPTPINFGMKPIHINRRIPRYPTKSM